MPPVNQVQPSNIPPTSGQQPLQGYQERPQLIAFANEYALIALFTAGIPVMGLIYSIKGRKEANRLGGAGRQFATAGLIISIIVTLFYAFILIFPAVLAALVGTTSTDY